MNLQARAVEALAGRRRIHPFRIAERRGNP